MKSAKTILAASNSVLMKFERPANQSAAVQNKRAAYGQKFYDKYAGKTPVVPEQKPSAVPYRVRVTADVLNIRKGAGTGYAVAGQIKGGGVIPSSKRKTELAPNPGESLKAALDGFLLIIQAEYNTLPEKEMEVRLWIGWRF